MGCCWVGAKLTKAVDSLSSRLHKDKARKYRHRNFRWTSLLQVLNIICKLSGFYNLESRCFSAEKKTNSNSKKFMKKVRCVRAFAH